MMETRDVLIAGGGYAGQIAARELVGRGLSVLMVDRRTRAGYVPQSTSGLARKWIRRFNLPVGGEATPITSFHLYGPNGTEALLGNGLLGEVGDTLVEPDLLGRMEMASIDRGLSVRHGTTVLRITRHDGEWKALLSPGGDFVRTRYVIDATGFQAWIGRQTGMVAETDPEDMHGGIEVSVPRPPSHPAGEVRMWLGHSVAPWGYAWGFASTENGQPYVRLGLGTPRVLPESAGVHFDRFRAAHPEYDGLVHHRTGGCIPTAPVARTLYRDGIFLTGDAGRLVCPLTGGGILGALTSGEAAALAITESDPESYPIRIGWLVKEMRVRWALKQWVYGLNDTEMGRLVMFLGRLELPTDGGVDPLTERRRVTWRLVREEPGLLATLLTRGRFRRALNA